MNAKPTLIASAAALAVATPFAQQPVQQPALKTIDTGERTRYAEMLIDAIVGVGFKTHAFAEYAVDRGFANLACLGGERGEPSWSWDRARLEACDEQELLSIYVQAKGAK